MNTCACEERALRIEELEARLTQAEKFKAYVHWRLDEADVPHHPPGPHGAEGCRIGDRLDWIFTRTDKLDDLEAQVNDLEAQMENLKHALWRIAETQPLWGKGQTYQDALEEAHRIARAEL